MSSSGGRKSLPEAVYENQPSYSQLEHLTAFVIHSTLPIFYRASGTALVKTAFSWEGKKNDGGNWKERLGETEKGGLLSDQETSWEAIG